MTDVKKIYSMLDKLELSLLKGVSVPFTFVIIDINRKSKFFIEIKTAIDFDSEPIETLLRETELLISYSKTIPYTQLKLINPNPVFKMLDKIRAVISQEIKK